jgi:chromate transporter
MKEEVVKRRQWMSEAEFLDLLGAANMIPGPTSTELAIHIGYRRAGWAGLIAAGLCFIVPAALIVLLCAWTYKRYGQLPQMQAVLYGMKPVIIAIVVQAILGLARTAIKNVFSVGLAAITLGLALAGADVLLLLFGAGAVAATVGWMRAPRRSSPRVLLAVYTVAAAMVAIPDALTRMGRSGGPVAYTPSALFAFFLKVGLTLYGGGYVLIAFLRDGLVHQWHWLTEAQLLDAIAVGQFTPGPLFTTATFVGYLVGGVPGSAIATLAIFLPSFILIAISGPLLPLLRRSIAAGSFLDGVNVAALALMAAVTAELARAALVDEWTIGIALVSAVLLIRFRPHPLWLIGGGAVGGLIIQRAIF